MTLTLGIGTLLKHSTTKFSSFTCQSASLPSAFVAHGGGIDEGNSNTSCSV